MGERGCSDERLKCKLKIKPVDHLLWLIEFQTLRCRWKLTTASEPLPGWGGEGGRRKEGGREGGRGGEGCSDEYFCHVFHDKPVDLP